MSTWFQQDLFLAKKEKLLLSRDEYVLIQMLYFCSLEPRNDAEIMSHGSIGKAKFLGLWQHCASKRLLKLVLSKGVSCLVITERGMNVLEATKKIIRELPEIVLGRAESPQAGCGESFSSERSSLSSSDSRNFLYFDF